MIRSGAALLPSYGRSGTNAVALDLPNPYAAVRRGRQARRGMDRKSILFRQYIHVLAKSLASPHGLAELHPASANRGGLFFYSGLPALRSSGQLRRSRRSCGAVVTLLRPFREKVTRAPKEHESSPLTQQQQRFLTSALSPIQPGEKRQGRERQSNSWLDRAPLLPAPKPTGPGLSGGSC